MIENKEIGRIVTVEEIHIYYSTTPKNIICSPVIYGKKIKSIIGDFTDNKLVPSKRNP